MKLKTTSLAVRYDFTTTSTRSMTHVAEGIQVNILTDRDKLKY